MSMDLEVIQKYKVGGNGADYTLVYSSEGKDDPFGDFTVQNAEELRTEIAIDLVGEVTMATTMENKLDELLDSYGGGVETVSIAAYTKLTSNYSSEQKIEENPEDEEEE